MSSRYYDPSDTIADGLAAFAVSTNDDSVTDSGAAAYRRACRKIREEMRPGDACRLALPAVIVGPARRTACFVIMLQDRVLIGYERGVLRRTAEVRVIPLATITDVRQHDGSTAGTRGGLLVTICGRPAATIALPPHHAADALPVIRDVLTPPLRKHVSQRGGRRP
jgi:hypothetical protein